MACSSQNPKPLIVLLTLDNTEFYNDLYKDFNIMLRRHANVERAITPSEARAYFNRDPKPAAILAADGSLTITTRVSLVQEAVSYVRTGGTLIFMGLFSSFSSPSNVDTLFSHFSLPWRAGEYHRTTFDLNLAMTLLDTNGMAARYSQKAVHLANVQQHNAVYLPSENSRIESLVFAPLPVDDLTEVPTAFASVGAGKLGYVGDVNNESETSQVVLQMCGLKP